MFAARHDMFARFVAEHLCSRPVRGGKLNTEQALKEFAQMMLDRREVVQGPNEKPRKPDFRWDAEQSIQKGGEFRYESEDRDFIRHARGFFAEAVNEVVRTSSPQQRISYFKRRIYGGKMLPAADIALTHILESSSGLADIARHMPLRYLVVKGRFYDVWRPVQDRYTLFDRDTKKRIKKYNRRMKLINKTITRMHSRRDYLGEDYAQGAEYVLTAYLLSALGISYEPYLQSSKMHTKFIAELRTVFSVLVPFFKQQRASFSLKDLLTVIFRGDFYYPGMQVHEVDALDSARDLLIGSFGPFFKFISNKLYRDIEFTTSQDVGDIML